MKPIRQYFKQTGLLFSILLILLGCSSPSQTKEDETKTILSESNSKNFKKTILFFGNSLTAGFGIEQEDSFTGLTQVRIDSLQLEYRVINGGLSGETTAGGLSRLDWFLEDQPSIFVLELGGNDGLRGILPSESKKNLIAIIEKVRAKYPETIVLLAGMQIPPNMGQEYTDEFKDIYPQIATEKNVKLIPFLLEGVAGNPELNLPDGIHPTEAGHLIVSETIWTYLQELL